MDRTRQRERLTTFSLALTTADGTGGKRLTNGADWRVIRATDPDRSRAGNGVGCSAALPRCSVVSLTTHKPV